MKKFIKTSILLAIPFLFLTACDNNNSENYSTISNTVTSNTNVTTPTTTNPNNNTVSNTTNAHEHTYTHYDKEDASYFDEGNIEYYYCSECNKYFDKDKKEISLENTKISKLTPDFSVKVNNDNFKMTLAGNENNHIVLKYEISNLKQNDLIKIIDNNKKAETSYFSDDLTNNLVSNDFAKACFTLDITPNGLYLSLDEIFTSGIVIKINDKEYKMEEVSYYDSSTKTYINGWRQMFENDEVVIIDKDNDITYDYDDISSQDLWNTYDFHKGENESIVFDNSGLYGFEFGPGDKKEIRIDKVFAPNNGTEFDVVIDDSNNMPLLNQVINSSDDGYSEFVWYINNDSVINASNYTKYIEDNGIHLYSMQMSLTEGMKLKVKDITNNKLIDGDHLVDYYGEKGDVSISDGYIVINKTGNYSILYLPLYDIISISSFSSSSNQIKLILGSNFIDLDVDSNGTVSYEADLTKNTIIMFYDSQYNQIDINSLNTKLDPTTCLYIEQTKSVMIYKDGHYKISFNTNTKALSIDGEVATSTTPTIAYLSVINQSVQSGNRTLSMTLNNKIFSVTNTFAAGELLVVSTYLSYNDTNPEKHYTLDANSTSKTAMFMDSFIQITEAGNYTVSYNTETELINIIENAV